MSTETPQPQPPPRVPSAWSTTPKYVNLQQRKRNARLASEPTLALLRTEVLAAIVRGTREQIATIDDPKAKLFDKRQALISLRSIHRMLNEDQPQKDDDDEDAGDEHEGLRKELEQMKGTGTNG